MGDNLKEKTLGAFKWSAVDRFGQQTVQFIIGILLARLLSPDDYGLLGMIMIFAALSFVLVESGFGQAIIRKSQVTELDYNTVFYTNIFISVLLYACMFFLFPYIAIFFGQPQLTVTGRVLFLAVLFNALYLVPYTMLGKIMDFKTIAKVNLLSTTLSGLTGIILAFTGFGVWALVLQQVTYHFFRMILFYFFVKWKPKLIYSFRIIKEFFGFSVNLLGTSALNVVFNYLYIIILGKFYPKSEVGFYSQANKLNDTFIFSFQAILVGSTYSLFSNIHNDEERFRRIFRDISAKTSLITFPAMLMLIVIAEPFIVTLLSAKWLTAVVYFQLLALASLFSPIYTLNINALNSRGKSRATFQIEIIKKSFIVLSVLACFKYGVLTMLIGNAIAGILSYFISVLYLKKHTNHYIKHQIADIFPNIVLGLLLALTAYLLSLIITNNYLLLTIQITTVLALYIMYIYKVHNDMFMKSKNYVVQRFSNFKKS